MSQKAKVDFVAADKTIAGQHNMKSRVTNEPAAKAEPAATNQPPADDAMVQQILERQAVFGF